MECTSCSKKLKSGAQERRGLCSVCSRRVKITPEDLNDPELIGKMLKAWQDGEEVTALSQRFRLSTQSIRETIATHSKPHFLTFLGML